MKYIYIASVALAVGLQQVGYKLYKTWTKPPGKQVPNIDLLKNALLSFALYMVYKDKVVNTPDVHTIPDDGSLLPSLSGCSLENAFFSYISDKEVYGDLLYRPEIRKQQDMIQHFIDTHLRTEPQVVQFFSTFMKKIFDISKSNSNHICQPKCCDNYDYPDY
jgi:hypothetical protein